MKNRVVCLMGPTASGKTALSLALAGSLPVEIVNVDPAQIYRGMAIGSGMPDKAARTQVPHHLMDCLDPSTPYSAAQFRLEAIGVIQGIIARGHLPLLVGGTMLYFKALQSGLSDLPGSDPGVRVALEEALSQQGLAALYAQLGQVDPITAARLSPTDPQRIVRALEVYAITAKPLSYWLAQPKGPQLPYQFLNIGLVPLTTPREVLHARIAQRFDEMLSSGLVAEAELLLSRPDLDNTKPAMRAVGYRQIYTYLQGESTFEQMRLAAIAATRQLAKRQLTWIRSWPEITLFDFLDPQLNEKVLRCISSRPSPK